MEGLKILKELPEEIETKIIAEFGTIEKFYKMVFDLYAEDYKIFKVKPAGYKERQAQIKSQIYDIEDKLDAMGVDGHDITTEISNDHTEIIVNRTVTNLDEYLQRFGTNFEEMSVWINTHLNM